ncbi:hypothetical protein A4S05_29780 [Nostoc sp. KVJ20]|uniref:hypothetical protein n=1 Tax=Nostoc sp. KVJ20 TaxID=457944 RepID=UPI00083DC8DE|nr:hypothetical protein [Nostoc sp. KVJ20]ODH01223.1 hypothetical protein A4S05_29780 [Nostoc sp. KVJ20]
MFIKLLKGYPPRYATSDIFDVRNRGNELYNVLQILKRISQLTFAQLRLVKIIKSSIAALVLNLEG